ncbi:MAG: efflux transporter outer membrane subunit [Puniceicoccales bacterium]|jgi:NodT family efflux transporter outer membrane factor (OMF) lipoprotein|nr:efflux transporter outer membrane subunit [Puniceicoccales bacterium]
MGFPSSIQHFAAAAVAVFFLSACAGEKGEQTKSSREDGVVLIPENWRNRPANSIIVAETNPAITTAWWTRFKDPLLNDLIVTALKDSPDVRTALSRIAESRARSGIDFAGLLPSLSGRVGVRDEYYRDRRANRSSNGGFYTAGLDASWEIDIWGKLYARYKAADAEVAQSIEEYRDVQVSLAAEVAIAYVTLRANEAQLGDSSDVIKALREELELARARENIGTRDAFDTGHARVQLEQELAGLQQVERDVAQSRIRLALLLGRTPGSIDNVLATGRGVPQVPAQFALAIPADTLRQRPDVRAAERAVEAASLRATSAGRELLPSLNISGSIGIEALKAGDIFSPRATIGSLLAGLTLPLFEGGRIRQNIAIQDEIHKQALIRYEATLLNALGEVENALVSVQRAESRLRDLSSAANAAIEVSRLADSQRNVGLKDFSQILNDKLLYLRLREQNTVVGAERALAHIQLYKVLGGGWVK